MLWVIGLVVLAGVAAVLLLAPVQVDLDVDVGSGAPRPPVRARVRWLFVSWHSGRPGRPKKARAADRRARRPEGTGRRRRFSVRKALATPGFLPRALRTLFDLARAIRPRALRAEVRIGLDDPASTGVLLGAVRALSAVTPRAGWRVGIEPDFTGPALAGRAEVRWVVRPGAVLWPVGRLVASPVAWRAFLTARR